MPLGHVHPRLQRRRKRLLLGRPHHSSLPALLVNGTRERLNRDLLSSMRFLLSELKIGPQDWMSALPVVAAALNAALLLHLGRNQVMTVILPMWALHHTIPHKARPGIAFDLAQARIEQIANIDETRASLESSARTQPEKLL